MTKSGKSIHTRNIFGQRISKHYNRQGKRTGTSYHEKNIFGQSVSIHRNREGKKTGKTLHTKDIFGQRKSVHYDTRHKTPSIRSFQERTSSGSHYTGYGEGLYSSYQDYLDKTQTYTKPEKTPLSVKLAKLIATCAITIVTGIGIIELTKEYQADKLKTMHPEHIVETKVDLENILNGYSHPIKDYVTVAYRSNLYPNLRNKINEFHRSLKDNKELTKNDQKLYSSDLFIYEHTDENRFVPYTKNHKGNFFIFKSKQDYIRRIEDIMASTRFCPTIRELLAQKYEKGIMYQFDEKGNIVAASAYKVADSVYKRHKLLQKYKINSK